MKITKLFYYLLNSLYYLVPDFLFRKTLKTKLQKPHSTNKKEIEDRVNYYNKLSSDFHLKKTISVGGFKKSKGWTYYFDLYSTLRFFERKYKFNHINGDVTFIPNQPCFVKSRPILDANHNSIILKLNKIRHFVFVKDTIPFHEKKNLVIWRGAGYQAHRQVVIKQFYNHPMCNIGQNKPITDEPWVKESISIKEQLNYKFILCIEGNDVATNLKWVMSSNSLCIMSKPKYETWFMEGRLQAGVHYVEVKDDYSDLIEKIDYYLKNENEALEIIHNANDWVNQFKDSKKEQLISLLVAKKYFEFSK